MKLSNWMIAACATLALAACDNSGKATGPASTGVVKGTTYELMSMGDPKAPVVLLEYASATCTHCAHFALEIFPEIKPRIDSGELRYEFREFLTAPAEVAMAGFQVARCAGEDKYFEVLDDLFTNQRGILMASQSKAARPALIAVAQRHGLSEAQFNVCIRDQKLFDTINGAMNEGIAKGVNSTPTLYLNDKAVDRSAYSAEGLNALIDEIVGKEPAAPAEEAVVTEEPESATEEAVPTATEE